MRLEELVELYDKLTEQQAFCGDVEYPLITDMRRAVWAYIQAIEQAGGSVQDKTVTRSWEIERDKKIT